MGVYSPYGYSRRRRPCRHHDPLLQGAQYRTHLLRRSVREGGSVRNKTSGNLSHLPEDLIDVIRRALKGERFVAAEQAFEVTASRTAT
jgi:hypothetical protein